MFLACFFDENPAENRWGPLICLGTRLICYSLRILLGGEKQRTMLRRLSGRMTVCGVTSLKKIPNKSRLPKICRYLSKSKRSSYYISPHSTAHRHYDAMIATRGNDERTCYFHRQLWSVVVPCSHILNLSQSKHAFCHASKDGMFSV